MYRGTTPTLYFKIKSIEDLTTITELWITIKSKNKVIQKTIKDIAFDFENNGIILELSQQETLSLTGCHVDIQMKFLLDSGKAFVSKIIEMPLEQVLTPQVITKPKKEENEDDNQYEYTETPVEEGGESI